MTADFNLEITPYTETAVVPYTQSDLEAELKNTTLTSAEVLERLERIRVGSYAVSPDHIMKKLREKSENAFYALTEKGTRNDSCKWHNVRDELLAFSKEYPEFLFTLDTIGEEHDFYRNYFLNGKVQDSEVVITYEEFSPTKLRSY